MGAGLNPLEAVASYLDFNLPDGIQVYGWAADTVKAPAVVLTPGSPFQAPYNQGGPSAVAWGVEMQLLVSRSQVRQSLSAIYDLRKMVTDLLVDAPYSTRWLSFDSIETVQVGEADLLQGTLTVVSIAQEA